MPSHAPPRSRRPLIAGAAVAVLTVVIIAAQLVGGRVSAHPRAAQQTHPTISPTATQPAAPTSPDTPSASPIETTILARTVQVPAATRTVRAVITQPGPTTTATVTATATATVTQTVTATSTTTVTQTEPALTTAGGTP